MSSNYYYVASMLLKFGEVIVAYKTVFNSVWVSCILLVLIFYEAFKKFIFQSKTKDVVKVINPIFRVGIKGS